MTGYRLNFVAGGSFFFTVNLADRRLQLLTESIDALRTAFRETQRHHPFTIDAIVVLPDHLHASGRCRKAMRISPHAGGLSKRRSPAS
jgi:putative transposase